MAKKQPINDDTIIFKGRDILARRIRQAQLKFRTLNAEVQAKIMKKLEQEGFKFTRDVNKTINRLYQSLDNKIDEVTQELERQIERVAIDTIKTSAKNRVKLTLSDDQVRRLTAGVTTDLFSDLLHSNNKGIRDAMKKILKDSLAKGDSVYKIARNLTEIDDVSVKLPKYIRDISQAARRAANDPTQRKEFLKVIKGYETQIKKLKPGSLGMQTATNRFVKDIQKANIDNIDAVINEWAVKKNTYIQTRVARTETLRAYTNYHREHAEKAPYIIGIELRTAHRHDPVADSGICESVEGVYLFSDYDIGDIPKIPGDTHPNCICSQINVYDEETINQIRSDEDAEKLLEEWGLAA